MTKIDINRLQSTKIIDKKMTKIDKKLLKLTKIDKIDENWPTMYQLSIGNRQNLLKSHQKSTENID